MAEGGGGRAGRGSHARRLPGWGPAHHGGLRDLRVHEERRSHGCRSQRTSKQGTPELWLLPALAPFLSLQGNHFLATDVRRSPDSCAAARSSAVVLSLSPSQGTCAPFVGGSVPTWRKEQEGWGPQRTHRGPTGVWLPLSADRPLGTPGGATTCPSGAPRRAPCPPRPGCERASAVEPISPSDVVGERKRAFPGMLGGRLRGGGRSREHPESGSKALSGILASSGKTARRAPHAPGRAQG